MACLIPKYDIQNRFACYTKIFELIAMDKAMPSAEKYIAACCPDGENHAMGQYANCRIQNPDIPRAGPGGAAHGGAAGRSGAGQSGTPTGRFAQETTVPSAPQGFQGIERNCPEQLPGRTDKGNHVPTEWRHTITR